MLKMIFLVRLNDNEKKKYKKLMKIPPPNHVDGRYIIERYCTIGNQIPVMKRERQKKHIISSYRPNTILKK